MNAVLSRRMLLAAGGALAVTFTARAQEAPQAGAPAKLPASLKASPRLAGWVQVGPDGAVTVFTGKAELARGFEPR